MWADPKNQVIMLGEPEIYQAEGFVLAGIPHLDLYDEFSLFYGTLYI